VIINDMPAERLVKVRVVDKYRVVDDQGRGYIKGDIAVVQKELAEVWLRNKWVERVSNSERILHPKNPKEK
jgi:hypothetical protein